jgi:hypothetical protein
VTTPHCLALHYGSSLERGGVSRESVLLMYRPLQLLPSQ